MMSPLPVCRAIALHGPILTGCGIPTEAMALVDVVVFSAPQLSLFELRDLARWGEGRRFAVPLLAVTSRQVKPDSDRMGYTASIENAGGTVLSGMCFYQSYAREIAEANNWRRLATSWCWILPRAALPRPGCLAK